jgi:3-oxoacyl-[acyl-carrier protein] reductase
MRLAGKVAIVTGAGQGIGKAYARRLLEEGAAVVVADIRGDWATDTAAELASDAKHDCLGLAVDVASEESTLQMTRATQERFGRVDILVNNAALFGVLFPAKAWDELSLDEWDDVMRVNVKGSFLCCRAVLPQMIAQRSGKIINISSGTVWTGHERLIHYVSSKAAVLGLTRSLAVAVGRHNVQVNAITPGLTQSEAVRSHMPSERAQMLADHTALRRVQHPEDLLGALVFLASADSDFMTGQTINVDGGLVMH